MTKCYNKIIWLSTLVDMSGLSVHSRLVLNIITVKQPIAAWNCVLSPFHFVYNDLSSTFFFLFCPNIHLLVLYLTERGEAKYLKN